MSNEQKNPVTWSHIYAAGWEEGEKHPMGHASDPTGLPTNLNDTINEAYQEAYHFFNCLDKGLLDYAAGRQGLSERLAMFGEFVRGYLDAARVEGGKPLNLPKLSLN